MCHVLNLILKEQKVMIVHVQTEETLKRKIHLLVETVSFTSNNFQHLKAGNMDATLKTTEFCFCVSSLHKLYKLAALMHEALKAETGRCFAWTEAAVRDSKRPSRPRAVIPPSSPAFLSKNMKVNMAEHQLNLLSSSPCPDWLQIAKGDIKF